jgi:hypothetical protein
VSISLVAARRVVSCSGVKRPGMRIYPSQFKEVRRLEGEVLLVVTVVVVVVDILCDEPSTFSV